MKKIVKRLVVVFVFYMDNKRPYLLFKKRKTKNFKNIEDFKNQGVSGFSRTNFLKKEKPFETADRLIKEKLGITEKLKLKFLKNEKNQNLVKSFFEVYLPKELYKPDGYTNKTICYRWRLVL